LGIKEREDIIKKDAERANKMIRDMVIKHNAKLKRREENNGL
jgi:hypothetical protein